jgi:hypothetical protein
MTGPGKPRLDVIAAINAVWYREYAPVAWLKAAVISKLTHDIEWGTRIVHTYTRDGRRDLEACRAVIDLFSEEVFLYHTPESMSRPVDGADFVLTDAASARFLAEMLADESEGVEQPGVDYRRLVSWFFEALFDAEQVQFFTTRHSPVTPGAAVAGMDDEVIGLFWLA